MAHRGGAFHKITLIYLFKRAISETFGYNLVKFSERARTLRGKVVQNIVTGKASTTKVRNSFIVSKLV